MALRINVPPLTRGLLVVLALSSALNGVICFRNWASKPDAPLGSRQFYAAYLTIIPGVSIIYPWTFLTATLVEQNIVGLIVTGLSIFYGGRYLERAWSSPEFTKFIVLVSLLPNVLTFAIYVMLFIITQNADVVSSSISGGVAIQGAFLVSFKQLVPEHTVTIAKGIISVRVKHFPAIFLLANTLSGIVLGTDTAMLLSWLGFLTSWTYLRFYRMSPSLTTTSTGDGPILRGDASDTFAFVYFFPEPFPALIAPFTDAVYNTFVLLRLCTPFSPADVTTGNEQAQVRGETGLPSLMNNTGRSAAGRGRREEADRRRALALKALDQRLHAAATNPQTPPVLSTKAESSIDDESPADGKSIAEKATSGG